LVSLKDKLKRVCESIIVPQYDELDSADVRIVGGAFEVFFYEITYYFNPPLDKDTRVDIMEETITVFNMMSLEKGSDLTIVFEKKK
jgi:hypothetical protein